MQSRRGPHSAITQNDEECLVIQDCTQDASTSPARTSNAACTDILGAPFFFGAVLFGIASISAAHAFGVMRSPGAQGHTFKTKPRRLIAEPSDDDGTEHEEGEELAPLVLCGTQVDSDTQRSANQHGGANQNR
jgi:hypothetical protein